MKIIKLIAENVKKLKAIEITPEGNMVVISGRNEQGKTSVLDSIWYALGGADALKGTTKPIREGQKTAKVVLTLEDITVTRSWTEKGTYLKIENKEGFEHKSPQATLDKLIGKLSFDPLAFSNMRDREQRETVLGLVKIDLDLGDWAIKRAAVYESRTITNRQAKEIEAQIAGLPTIPKETPNAEVSAGDVLKEQAAAQEVLRINDVKRAGLSRKSAEWRQKEVEITNRDADIESLKGKLAILEAKQVDEREMLKEIAREGVALKAEIENLQDPDLTIYESKITLVEETNRAVRAKMQREVFLNILASKKESSEVATATLTELDQQKVNAVNIAKFPIEGLAFNDDGVTYREIPFSQCSSAERLRVSLAMAMALNPKVKVLRITDGSLLDKENLRVIEEMVKAQDYQLWIERVSDDGGVGIVIEDGMVAQ